MEKVISIIRIAAILALSSIVIIGVFGCPDENLPLGQWVLTMILSKVIAFVAFVGVLLLIGGVEACKAFFKSLVKDDELKPGNANH